MKLQIAFDVPDLNTVITMLPVLQSYADIIEVGSLLIYKYGEEAVKQFRQHLPHTVLLVDGKIVDRGKEATSLFIQAGADWVTVMAGTHKAVIHSACTNAHELGKKVMLDLLDVNSFGQAVLEAKSLGADALVVHRPSDEQEKLLFLDSWEIVKGNTQLPIFVSGITSREAFEEVLTLNPDGVIISLSGEKINTWEEDCAFFSAMIKNR